MNKNVADEAPFHFAVLPILCKHYPLVYCLAVLVLVTAKWYGVPRTTPCVWYSVAELEANTNFHTKMMQAHSVFQFIYL